MKKYLLLIIISFGVFSCTTKKADMIIYNGNIYTVNDLNPLVSAVAVKDGKILDLGDWQKLKRYKSDRTDLIDLDGKTATTPVRVSSQTDSGLLQPPQLEFNLDRGADAIEPRARASSPTAVGRRE